MNGRAEIYEALTYTDTEYLGDEAIRRMLSLSPDPKFLYYNDYWGFDEWGSVWLTKSFDSLTSLWDEAEAFTIEWNIYGRQPFVRIMQ